MPKIVHIICFFFAIIPLNAEFMEEKPRIEFFTKHSVGLGTHTNDLTPTDWVFSNQFSVYINSFGNTIDCDDNNLLACIVVNLFQNQ